MRNAVTPAAVTKNGPSWPSSSERLPVGNELIVAVML